MKYPNRRYANPVEFQNLTLGLTVKQISQRLYKSERTVRDWLLGNKKIPFWVTELLRLQQLESNLVLRQMGIKKPLGIVNASGEILQVRFNKDSKLKPVFKKHNITCAS